VHHGLDPRRMLQAFMNRATKAEAEVS
jgi:hypothetical protein